MFYANDKLCDQIKEDSDAYFKWGKNIEMDPEETGWRTYAALSSSVVGSCEHGNNIRGPQRRGIS
jgi:hypothetical protein